MLPECSLCTDIILVTTRIKTKQRWSLLLTDLQSTKINFLLVLYETIKVDFGNDISNTECLGNLKFEEIVAGLGPE